MKTCDQCDATGLIGGKACDRCRGTGLAEEPPAVSLFVFTDTLVQIQWIDRAGRVVGTQTVNWPG